MGSDALAPAFVHNVFDPLEIGGAQRCDVAARTIDDFGETRQFDLLDLGKQIWIKVLKQSIAWTRLCYRCDCASQSYLAMRWRHRRRMRLPLPAIPSASVGLEIALSSEHRL